MEASGPLPECARAQSVALNVQVQEVRERIHGQTLLLRVLESRCAELVSRNIRATNATPVRLRLDDLAVVTARLKRPWGSVNPGGFNYRLWLLGQDIRAVGYVIAVQRHLNPQQNSGPVGKETAPELLYRSLLRAITLGDRSGVTEAQWTLFRETGTVHLVIVSGLHVGVLAGIALVLVGLLSRLPLQTTRLRQVSQGMAIVTVVAYAVLTGLEPPVVRAASMFLIGAVAAFSMRQMPLLMVLGVVATLMLIVQPYLLLRSGFWLSFGAVAALVIAFEPRQRRLSWVLTLVVAQFVIFVVMTPATGFLVDGAYLVTPLANLIVVPLMTAVVIPVAMFGTAIESLDLPWAQPLLLIADFGLHVVIQILAELQNFRGDVLHTVSWPELLLVVPLGVFMLLPLGLPQRLLLALGWVLVLTKLPSRPPVGEFAVTVLDVGQGNAAIVDTHRHRMVIDTGPAFPDGFNAGHDIVLPALKATGPFQLDSIVISHGDLDHIGGATAVKYAFPNSRYIGEEGCLDDALWRWDGVTIMTHRISNSSNENDRSCAVFISNGRRSAYFPGDIGHASELILKSRLSGDVDLMIAPHHGSLTSSHPAFVKELTPRIVVFSAGFQNRYGHPASRVVARYVRRGSWSIWTYQSGAIYWRSWRNTVTQSRRHILGLYVPIVSDVDELSQR